MKPQGNASGPATSLAQHMDMMSWKETRVRAEQSEGGDLSSTCSTMFQSPAATQPDQVVGIEGEEVAKLGWEDTKSVRAVLREG